MRTNQFIVAVVVVAAVFAGVTACSSSSNTATTTSAVVKSSSEGDAGSGGGGAADGNGGGATDAESVALPDDWPDELALPDGVVAIEATDISDYSWKVVGRVDGDAKAALDEVEANLAAADWNLEDSNFEETALGGFGGVSGQNRQMTVAIVLGPDATGDTTELTILLAEKTSE